MIPRLIPPAPPLVPRELRGFLDDPVARHLILDVWLERKGREGRRLERCRRRTRP